MHQVLEHTDRGVHGEHGHTLAGEGEGREGEGEGEGEGEEDGVG